MAKPELIARQSRPAGARRMVKFYEQLSSLPEPRRLPDA
jgi:hypothetical protein